MMKQNHPFHLVEPSPWPLMASAISLFLTSGLVKWFSTNSFNLVLMSLMSLFLTSYLWWRDISREGSFQGHHTKLVNQGLKMGVMLFIISEVMFFLSFFWAFFHSSLSPDMILGIKWPPHAIQPFNPLEIPLLNTLILLSSGLTITWSHHALMEGSHLESTLTLIITIILAIYFTLLQKMEYQEAHFTISDSVYGSSFFVATGFHGLHVIVGSIFLTTALYRLMSGLISSSHHLGTEAAIWYWHFVDLVWLFLYTWIYYWAYFN